MAEKVQAGTAVRPADVRPAISNTTINRATNVHLTVPAGTPEQQQVFLKTAAQKSFAAVSGPTPAEMGVYAT